MIYEGPVSVWESRISFTKHLGEIAIPDDLHGAIYRLMAAPTRERINCVDIADINVLLGGNLSVFVAAAPKRREGAAFDALSHAMHTSNLKPDVCCVVHSGSRECEDRNGVADDYQPIDWFHQFRGSMITFIKTVVADDAPPQHAYRFEIWVASGSGAKSA